jgi:hypothetical protein
MNVKDSAYAATVLGRLKDEVISPNQFGKALIHEEGNHKRILPWLFAGRNSLRHESGERNQQNDFAYTPIEWDGRRNGIMLVCSQPSTAPGLVIEQHRDLPCRDLSGNLPLFLDAVVSIGEKENFPIVRLSQSRGAFYRGFYMTDLWKHKGGSRVNFPARKLDNRTAVAEFWESQWSLILEHEIHKVEPKLIAAVGRGACRVLKGAVSRIESKEEIFHIDHYASRRPNSYTRMKRDLESLVKEARVRGIVPMES